MFKVEVHPRVDFRLEAVDNSLSDINYFKYEVIDDKIVAIKLAHSLEDLVDRVCITFDKAIVKFYKYFKYSLIARPAKCFEIQANL